MKKESVIEREIRIAREREEAFRREKGLLSSHQTSTTPAPATTKISPRTTQGSVTPANTTSQDDRRNVQHRIATSRIQMEISETSQRERELVDAGKILTLSEDTVDAKVGLFLYFFVNAIIGTKYSSISSYRTN